MKAIRLHERQATWLECQEPDILDALQAAVGGDVEAFNIGDHGSMYVDERGILKRLPVNDLASEVVRLHSPEKRITVVGPAVIVGPLDDEGNDLDVPEILIDTVRVLVDRIR
ncbi:Domain of uncharacterised function (DUF3846) [Mycobacteroides abscessus subsp. abscessus]|uniref:DUF3846 domain-containing protein n=1 Tax=Mycobacteroides abscessus TaxID=36809 RepID=UPI00092B6EAC|nr:DUF3846 domain-containing protein [Mycobacteroides abscessus]SIH25193.1 Domain of uncharacterised function (DUF3846) [Mycobacteroides abscessus subsp. abscessus]